jgi:hypothetical protein
MYYTYSNVSITFQFQCTKYIYSNAKPNLIPFSMLILGTKVPQSLILTLISLMLLIITHYHTTYRKKCCAFTTGNPITSLEVSRKCSEPLRLLTKKRGAQK